MTQARPAPSSTAYLALLCVLFAAAVTPIAIRNAQQEGVPSLYIIAVRLIIASVVLGPIVFKRYPRPLSGLATTDWLWALAAGTFLALNLALLFFALEYTSVLVTSVMRRTSPLWVIGLEILLLGAVFTRQVWLGLLLTFVGSLLVGVGGITAIDPGANPLFGAILALVGSLCMAIYLLIGRKLSALLPSLAYSWLVFTVAGLVSTLVVLVTGTPLTGYSAAGYAWTLVVTIIAQFIGHIGINLGLRYFPATYVSMSLQASVVVSAILAFFLLQEVPSLLQTGGSILILAGIILASLPRSRVAA